jgi:hypothetical protein
MTIAEAHAIARLVTGPLHRPELKSHIVCRCGEVLEGMGAGGAYLAHCQHLIAAFQGPRTIS